MLWAQEPHGPVPPLHTAIRQKPASQLHINEQTQTHTVTHVTETSESSGRGAVQTGPGDLQALSPRTRAIKSHPPPQPGCPAHVIKHQVKMLTAPDSRQIWQREEEEEKEQKGKGC
ncbi:unnamed protein product [Leuciscus chuanchicus]